MAIKSSGTLSFSEIAAEFGAGQPHSLSQFYRGGSIVADISVNTNVPTSGVIRFSNFYNATNVFVFTQTISGSVNNYNLRNAVIAAGWNQVMPVITTLTINSGVVIGSSSTGSYSFSTGAFPVGSITTIFNNGVILGRGGNGGFGSSYGDPFGTPPASAGSGSNAGPAMLIATPTNIHNNNVIAGGGGGGGGGAFGAANRLGVNHYAHGAGGGGGGGRGTANSSGGSVANNNGTGTVTVNTQPVAGGTGSSGGAGGGGGGGTIQTMGGDGVYLTGYGGAGGSGGGYASTGGGGGGGSAVGSGASIVTNSPGSGGAPGNAVVLTGSGSVTWNVLGSVFGSRP
jgi:hypothetical protein